MTELKRLLAHTEYEMAAGREDMDIRNITTDSRRAGAGDVFVCIKGARNDGHRFAAEVAKKGVAAIVTEQDPDMEEIQRAAAGRDVAVIRVDDTKSAWANMSAAYFDYPAEKLKTIGITGTKGKTTTAYMVYAALEKAGIRTGLIGTVETVIGKEHIPAENTTPDAYKIQETFDKMVKAGLQAVVMEVSSQGLMLRRVSGFTFDYGVFTNLGKDHISEIEHKDFEDYMSCKARLFRQCKHGIFNIDDGHVQDMLQNATCTVETFGVSETADLRAENISLYKEPGVLGIAYDLTDKENGGYPIKIDIPGRFNVYNSLTAIAICRHFVKDMGIIENALHGIRVRGRVESVPVSEDFIVMVDYAHNAMSLESLLKSLREYEPKRIVTVFGCGGNRDRNRRFEMGEVSSRLADFTVVTSDNPRNERPEDILADIVTGVKKGPGAYVTIADRKEAIKYAIENGKEGDIIVIAGKGHEDYQIIGDVKYHMDDRELVEEARIAVFGRNFL